MKRQLKMQWTKLFLIFLFCAAAGAQERNADSAGAESKQLSSERSEVFYLPTDAIGLSPLSGRVVGFSEVMGGYTLAIELMVKNCSDQISPLSFSENEGVVTISVWNIARKLSYEAPCSAHPTFHREILVRSPHPFVRAIFLGK